jgi:phenylalanyl-tRNA synthetase beta chain
VPLILPGASLPPKPGDEPFTIKVGKIRGVESHGMLCSHEELGIDAEAIGHRRKDGLLILRRRRRSASRSPNTSAAPAATWCMTSKVTPNRPDLNSVIGIAREISAVTGNALNVPVISDQSRSTSGERPPTWSRVKLEAADLCPRYTARVIQGVKVGPSPESAAVSALERVGFAQRQQRRCGRPELRDAGDRPAVARVRLSPHRQGCLGPSDHRRCAAPPRREVQDRWTTGTHAHEPTTCSIADEAKGIALAGVMGGAEHRDQLCDTWIVLIECAYFAPTNIRRTEQDAGAPHRRQLPLRTAARTSTPATTPAGAAAQLILETAGGTLAPGVVDAYPEPARPKEIALRFAKTCRLCSAPPPSSPAANGQRSSGGSGLGATLNLVTPHPQPSGSEFPPVAWTLSARSDLIEEIARLYGVDKIPSDRAARCHGGAIRSTPCTTSLRRCAGS